MKQNIGSPDRIIRLILGCLLLGTAILSQSVLLAVTGIFSLYEALAGWCVLYQLIGRNTCPVKHRTTNGNQHIPLLVNFISGLGILVVAILMNITAFRVGILTWYDFLRNVGERGFTTALLSASPDTLLFLFCLYPLVLGTTGQVIFLWANRFLTGKQPERK